MIEELPAGWAATRATLQACALVLTAFPRAASDPDPRWSNVAMEPTERGFVTRSVTLTDGSAFRSWLDLVGHRIVIEVDGDQRTFDLGMAPSPAELGRVMEQLATDHGTQVAIDSEYLVESEAQVYDPAHAEAFLESARFVVAAMRTANTGLTGEIEGPHLWPHGFDIATERYSNATVPHDGGEASSQIAVGWYPSEGSYLYVNPWPFRSEWVDEALPHGAIWHTEGWQGAELRVPPSGLEESVLTELALAIHQIASGPLGF